MNLHRLWSRYVMRRGGWWLPILVVMCVGVGSMLFVGVRTYQDAPPIPDFVSADGEIVLSRDAIVRGQVVFQKYALMDYGSFFGDGAARGTDFTADALHEGALAAVRHYANGEAPGTPGHDAALARTQREYRQNRRDPSTNRAVLSDGQVHAYAALVQHYREAFAGRGPQAFHPAGYIRDEDELRDLAGFFYWGAWVCAAQRPGKDYSYTHNWPYDELVGNRPSAPVHYWSIASVLGLILALGAVLYLYGRYGRASGWNSGTGGAAHAADAGVDAHRPTRLQHVSYRFFVAAAVLFVVQVLAGILTVHDFLGLTRVFGVETATFLPITVTRGWHLQLALLWITACWIGASLFLLSTMHREELPGQVALARFMFWLVVLLVAGMFVGVWLGPLGALGERWNLLGNQGWEFVELGKLWQVVLLLIFATWAALVGQTVLRVRREGDAWILPKWLFYAVLSIALLFLSAFVAKPTTNFVIADFWRWAVVHMWAEAFLEVFTTVLLAYVMYLTGFITHAGASRIVYLATLLFLGSGLLGISHNFYWNAKPVATLAVGGIFSTLQVVPLILLTLEAWAFRSSQRQASQAAQRPLAQSEAFLFLLGVNFWNFLGAGVFGFIINLPIVNYYEHGTYLTVNHGHAALMGVYGNLAVAAILFCARYLVGAADWPARTLRRIFWSLNLGLALMLAADLFPVGVNQLVTVLEHGLAYGRSQQYVQGEFFQALTWARIVGGALFVLGGVLPLAWFVVTRATRLKPATTHVEAVPRHPAAEAIR
jgi:nitric oxide reductase subunit B